MTKRATIMPVGFSEFCRLVLGIALTLGQATMCAVAFDGADPCQLVGAQRELARELFGAIDTIPAAARAVFAGTIGARSGKTWLGALRLLHLALVCNLAGLAAGEIAAAIIIAPDMRLARQALRYAIGAARAAASIARLIEAETADSLLLRRPDGRRVELVCLPAKRGGSAGRGRSLVGALMDESAFFYGDDGYTVNDVEVYRALAPRVLRDGQLMVLSTAWLESGLLHDLHTTNFGAPSTALAAHATTSTMRSGDAHIEAMVERERERDPENASREFDGVALSGGSTEFFDPHALALCVREDLPLVIAAEVLP